MNYIQGFEVFADELAKDYTQQIAAGNDFSPRRQLWQLELAMHKMENELNIKMTEIIEQAEQAVRTDMNKLEIRLTDVRRFAINELLVKNLEVMNNDTKNRKATILR